MASFNAISLEQNALKRAKIERRRGPKPVRAALLWAQTVWLDGHVTLHEGRVQFQSQDRAWKFDGALLHSTKRALDKLSMRPLSRLERERLEERRHSWALWHACASLENLSLADLRARMVLESLLVAPLVPSPAREVAALSPRNRSALLTSFQSEIFPPETRELARWVVWNGAFIFWRQNLDFPVSIAARLGLDGELAPLLFGCGGLSLSLDETIALLEKHPPARVREIAEFWMQARWLWPDVRPVCALLKRVDARTFRQDWRELEDTWRACWTPLWREIASRNVEAAREALRFHEQICDENLLRWSATIHKPATRARLLAGFEARQKDAFELLQKLASHPDAASLLALTGELWREGRAVMTEGFWDDVLLPTLDAARLIGVDGARELRALGFLCLARWINDKPELLQLALEWARRGEGIEWGWTLAQLPSDGRSVALLRQEANALWSLCDKTPGLKAGPMWDALLQDDRHRSLSPFYWRLVRALMPVFATRMVEWHPDNTSNLREWLTMWAGVCCDLGWDEARATGFCEVMLHAVERGCAVTKGAPDVLDSLETLLEIFARLSDAAGETEDDWKARCGRLTSWLCGGTSRGDKWWEALPIARKLAHRPRFCAALLLAGEREPTFVRDLLPHIEALQRLHLCAGLDRLEDEPSLADGQWGELKARFPALESQINDLSEWLQRAEDAPETRAVEIPPGVRAVLNRAQKWRREADFLRARLVDSPHPHLQTRLENLEKRLETGDYESESELAEALKTALETFIQKGLRVLVTSALRGRLRALCGSVADRVAWNDYWANALLLACELESNRKWATKLLRGQSQNPSGWQQQIPANQNWLEQFARSGANIESFEEAHRARIGEWELWIERDALQILQMGNRFSTCLSRGGCNAHSTIANALDANKLVIYARRNGQIEARQLWVITNDWKLGGFSIYANLSQAQRDISGLHRAFWEFANAFARVCKFELSEDTNAEISEICGASWYDDGLVLWSELQGPVKVACSPRSQCSKSHSWS